jgi:putative tryptophan/tyrosine transport system substrate-binding protein
MSAFGGKADMAQRWCHVSVVKIAASALHVNLQSLEVQDLSELERAFDAMAREHSDALLVLSDSFTTFYRTRLAELAAKHRLPALYGHAQYIEAGGLMSYGPSISDNYGRAAGFVDKILKGTKPTDLPAQQPTKFELIINLRTAKTLGLEISPALLTLADKVIE